MLVKVNDVYKVEKKVNVTLLDIDDFGSLVPIKDLDKRKAFSATVRSTFEF